MMEFGSPIERLFFDGFFQAQRQRRYCQPLTQIHTVDIMDGGRFYIVPQYPVLSYRADFLCGALSARVRPIVVECDGHQYHERTKAQAAHDRARDRAMQAAGYLVFRFTGAELYADAAGCAGEVTEMVDEMLLPRLVRRRA